MSISLKHKDQYIVYWIVFTRSRQPGRHYGEIAYGYNRWAAPAEQSSILTGEVKYGNRAAIMVRALHRNDHVPLFKDHILFFHANAE